MNSANEHAWTRLCLIFVTVLIVAGCKVTIESPTETTYTYGASIHFDAEYNGTGTIKWKDEYTAEDGSTDTLDDSEFKQNTADTGKGYPWEFYKSDLAIGVHKITAYKNDDYAEITIVIHSFCDAPDTDCSGLGDGVCTVGICDRNANSCVVSYKEDGTSCDDGDPTTYGEVCVAGECLAENGLLYTDYEDFGVDYISVESQSPFIQDQTTSKLNLYSGEVVIAEEEMYLKGRGIDFKVKRHYRSGLLQKESAVFGNWDADFNEYLIYSETEEDLRYKNGSGQVYELMKVSDDPATWVSASDGFSGILQEKSVSRDVNPESCTVDGVRASRLNISETGIVLRESDGTRKFFINMEEFSGEQKSGNVYRLVKTMDINGNQIQYTYKAVEGADRKRLWCVIDTMKRPVLFEYENDSSRNISEISHFDGRRIQYGYNAAGQLVSVKHQDPDDNSGNTFFDYVKYTYAENDANNPLASIQTADDVDAGRSAGQTFEYDESYRLRSWNVRDSEESIGSYSFTYVRNNVASDVDLNSISIETTQIDPSNTSTTFRYNKAGLLREKEIQNTLQVRSGDPANSDPDSVLFRYYWDNEGNLVKDIKPEGNQAQYQYSNEGSGFDSIEEIEGYWDTHWHDRYYIHNLVQKTVRAGLRGDGLGSYLANSVTTYIYEPVASKLYKKTDPQGGVRLATFDYQESSESDVQDALLSEMNLEGSGSYIEFPEAMEFELGDINGDDDTDSMSATTIQVNMGDVVQDGQRQSLVKTIQYDNYGRLQKVFDERGALTEYTYGALPVDREDTTVGQGYLDKVVVDVDYDGRSLPEPAKASKTEIFFDDAGKIIAKYYPDGTYEIFNFNPWTTNQTLVVTPITLATRGGSSGSKAKWKSYTYSKLGRLLETEESVVENINSDFVGDAIVNSYAYDSMGRRTETCKSVTSGVFSCKKTRYDALGRKVETETAEGVPTTYTYDSFGRLYQTEKGSGSDIIRVFRYYDANGNMTSRREDVDNNDDGIPDGPEFVYDGFDRLVAKNFEDNTSYQRQFSKTNKIIEEKYVDFDGDDLSRVNYDYDAFNRLTQTTVDVFDLENSSTTSESLIWT